MHKKILVLLALSTSLVAFGHTSVFTPVSQAQGQTYPYSFCAEDTETPPQELVDSIAYVLDSNYEGDVKTVSPICYGQMNNRKTWFYKVEFNNGTALDVAIAEGEDGRLLSVQDSSKSSADANGWTKWMPLKSPK